MATSARIVVATALFAAIHSALASRKAKATFARHAGAANAEAWYRPLYVAQSVVTSGALLAYGLRQPRRLVYRIKGRRAWLVRAGQAFAAVQLLRGIHAIGLRRLVGADSLRARLRNERVPRAPVAQGPERDPRTGDLRHTGPFTSSRHPLNFWAVPLFWCTPELTTRRLAFNLAATVYLALGSKHEEIRLSEAYGDAYQRYATSGPAFFVPLPRMRRLELDAKRGAGRTRDQCSRTAEVDLGLATPRSQR